MPIHIKHERIKHHADSVFVGRRYHNSSLLYPDLSVAAISSPHHARTFLAASNRRGFRKNTIKSYLLFPIIFDNPK